MSEEIKFCPLLTIVRAGQASYSVCKINCVFFVDDECVFITTAKTLKMAKTTDTKQKDQK
jgi:hypothetical protein